MYVSNNSFVIITGVVSRSMEIKDSKTGNKWAPFSVAVSNGLTGPDGSSLADFYECTLFDKRMDTAVNSLVKGAKVQVMGTLNFKTYTAKDGTTRVTPALRVQNFTVMSKPNNGTANTGRSNYGTSNYAANNTAANDGLVETDDTEEDIFG